MSLTILLRRGHIVLFAILFTMDFGGLWVSVNRSPYLIDFVHHINRAALAWWLMSFSAGSAFLATVIIAKLLEILTHRP